jgi:hypothetical protein
MRPELKKTYHQRRAGGVAHGEGPEFKSQYHQKKRRLLRRFKSLRLPEG